MEMDNSGTCIRYVMNSVFVATTNFSSSLTNYAISLEICDRKNEVYILTLLTDFLRLFKACDSDLLLTCGKFRRLESTD